MKFSSRLHVGGLAPDVTVDEISRRLAPFGDVVSVDIKLDKFSTEPQQCRGFAFVDLTVSQESEIDRCMSVLNHCRWKGRKLGLFDHYRVIHRGEWPPSSIRNFLICWYNV